VSNAQKVRGLILVLVATVLLVAGGVFAVRSLMFDTEYAPGFSTRRINQVKKGDTLQAVVNLVGHPLQVCFIDPTERSASSDWRPWKTTLLTVSSSAHFVVRYSIPVGDVSYHANEVWFSGGRVADVRSYDSWD